MMTLLCVSSMKLGRQANTTEAVSNDVSRESRIFRRRPATVSCQGTLGHVSASKCVWERVDAPLGHWDLGCNTFSPYVNTLARSVSSTLPATERLQCTAKPPSSVADEKKR